MKKINNSIVISLIFGCILPFMFVGGILLIVFFAGKNTLLMVLGIIGVVLGFYATPIVWTNYGGKKSYKRMLQLVYNENIYSIAELATQLGISEKNALQNVRYLINKGYLTGFLLVDESYLKLNQNVKQEKTIRVIKCPSCGAKTKIENEKGVCEYCGEMIDISRQ